MRGNKPRWLNGAFALLAAMPSFASEPATEPLAAQIETFIRQQIVIPVQRIDVEIKTPDRALPDCAAPQFALPSRNRVWGNLSIRMTCGADKYFVQTRVQVTGDYLVSARPIPPKQTLSEKDVKWQRGRLDAFATPPVTDLSLVLGAVSQRMIGAGQPLQAKMLRQPWAVKTGQTVQVIASGDGFNISSEGKVMNNALVNDKVRVRMNSGQIVNGLVDADGTVKVAL
ncbi:flagellar basal body P-ring formation protein FlgA [Affinibrenneria salicis]|uniref:Flagella basal body P-ring formation protein FlgA n=1 Tax=Affinibrenneria salicis TaxID=2590031 RepID=A0A5J5FUL8_9GAMM|nr:flagellar basal body P-ring formation chaperone FlgA [Affinibrenneria salicis]KAA8996706.1 flagellar basal body P-ring formation protein FlgA [Affinibrenneria salicis]